MALWRRPRWPAYHLTKVPDAGQWVRASTALAGASVLYAKEWGTTAYYGDAEADAKLRADLGDWCVREGWFAGARPDAKFMHCLPVRRNVAVADEVLDGPRALVRREAHNRLTVQMAVLHRMLAG